MISNLDIDRRKTKPSYKKIATRLTDMAAVESRILKRAKTNRYLSLLLKRYAMGVVETKLPKFCHKRFPYVVVSKFNSYDLECRAVFDYINMSIIFLPRRD